MVVAVAVVGVVQVAVHQIVHVVSVRHRRVAAIGAMLMGSVVTGAIVRGTARRVLSADIQRAFIVVAVMGAVKVAVVQVVDMIAVLHRSVAAAGAVNMVVLFVYVMAHCKSPFVRIHRLFQRELSGPPAFRWHGPRR